MALDALPSTDEKRAAVRAMFDRIAPRYDRMNRLMTAGLDQRWRRAAADAIGIGAGDRVLDLACGTGDLAELCAGRGARVIGLDFAGEMLRGAQQRRVSASFVQGDGSRLPLRSDSIDAVVCGFALRNFVALAPVFQELARVLTPGGRVALLDVDRPTQPLVRFGHSIYFDRIVPFVGGLISDRQAYSYLPQSTVYLPPAPELRATLSKAGFGNVAHRRMLLGSVQLLTGELPQ
jgi:demethylmenaquinone methyltransferase/2-methoxy-6-polyprenyl-1,4-benzoquinol methylase